MNFEYKIKPTLITKAKENVFDNYPIDKELNRTRSSTRIFLVWRKPVE